MAVLKLISSLFALLFLCPSAQAHIVIECKIMNEDGKIIRNYGRSLCAFLDDGRWIASSKKSKEVALFSAQMMPLWKVKAQAHHQINFDQKKEHILIMDASYGPYKGKQLRFDKLSVYDLRGRKIKSFDFQKNTKHIEKFLSKNSTDFIMALPEHLKDYVPKNVTHEYSHANSFYEIPENPLSQKNSAFAAGNYIVNVNNLRKIFIFDKALKKILLALPQPANALGESNMHDVQLQSNGWLLAYSNLSPDSNKVPFSSIDEWNPLTGERKSLFQATPPESFFSDVCGGAQKLDQDLLLLSDITQGGRVLQVDLKTQKVLKQWPYPEMDEKKQRPQIFQQAKSQDLTQFLKNNKGL